MKRSAGFSVGLHAILLLLAYFGLPSLFQKKDPTEQVVTVDLLPISSISNVKTQSEQGESRPEPPKQTPPKPVEPPKPKAVEEPPKPKEAESIAKIKEPKEKTPEEKAKERAEEAKKKKEKEKQKLDKQFDDVLNDLNKPKPKQTRKDFDDIAKSLGEGDAPKTSKGSSTYDPSKPLSISEMDAIRQQVSAHWSVPSGGKDVKNMHVIIRVCLDEGGNVLSAIADRSSFKSDDSFFVTFAESAVRAIKASSPLKNLPPEKYSTWKEFDLNFDPKEMLN